MKIKVSEATNLQLNWMVARCVSNGVDKLRTHSGQVFIKDCDDLILCQFTTDWVQGGPIIEWEKITTSDDGQDGWVAGYRGTLTYFGPTMLVAGLRAYVTSKLGDEVEVPEELA